MVDLLRERDEWEQLKENIALLREEIAQIRNSKPAEPLSQQPPIQPPIQQTTPVSSGFGIIKEVMESLGSVKDYENRIKKDYIDSLVESATQGIEPESGTDFFLKAIGQAILNGQINLGNILKPKAQANEAQQDTPDVSPLPPVPIQQTEVAKVEINKDILMEQIPNYIKIGIRSGELTLQQLKGFVMPEMQKRGIPITEQLIEEIYNEVKNDKTPEDRGINIQAHKTSKSEGGKAKKGKKADK